MAGHFTIEPDPTRGLLHVRMSGFYTRDDVRRYHAAVTAASEALARPASQQVMLCDISNMHIQSQEIVAAFQQVMSDPRYSQRRVGFVVASTLARMQLLRIIDGRAVQVFMDVRAAETWLVETGAEVP